jgi:UPF0042 nucleotide-binding protein
VKQLRIIIITGLSGSGKSTAIDAFEDAGFYCVDNMPVQLLPKFLQLPIESKSKITGLAFVMDLREIGFLTKYTATFKSLKKKGYNFKILFLEAEEETLLKRYSQTRRQHPLADGKGLLEGIRIEKDQLKNLKASADKIIDTTRYSVHDLKRVVNDIAQKGKHNAPMGITITSFGFKFGIPYDADLIFDVRFLANPYFVAELKDLTGKDEKVKDFVLNNDETRTFLEKLLDFLDYLIPLYEKEGKSYLTVALGCTGGRHRSVAITQSIFEHIKKPNRQIIINHRDIDLLEEAL